MQGYRPKDVSSARIADTSQLTLWIALLRVALKLPKSRPWKAEVKDRTDSWGVPGDWFHMVESDFSASCLV